MGLKIHLTDFPQRRALILVALIYLCLEVFIVGQSLFLLGSKWKLGVLLSCFIAPSLYLFPRFFPLSSFTLGASLFLFGSHSYSTHNQVFELLLAQFALALAINSLTQTTFRPLNSFLYKTLLLFTGAMIISIAWLPLDLIIDRWIFWAPAEFMVNFLSSVPGTVEYSIVGINRLVLFTLAISFLSMNKDAQKLYQFIGSGLIVGALVAAVFGIFDYIGWVSLQSYAPRENVFRLQSFFRNPGWYAQFISITTPFILLGFFYPKRTKLMTVGLFASLLLAEISIILTGSRTSWVIYPLILLVCWLVFYGVNHLSTSRLSKKVVFKTIAMAILSLPVTLVISLLIISTYFSGMEKGDQQEELQFKQMAAEQEVKNPEQRIGNSEQRVEKSEKNTFLYDRAKRINNPMGRIAIWQDSMLLIQESPLLGLGFESYRFWVKTLSEQPDSLYYQQYEVPGSFDTPHNFYIQLILSSGFFGLILWLTIVSYLLTGLLYFGFKEKRGVNVSMALSLAAFHIYGLTQNMAYISVIWFIAFLIIGYGLTLKPFDETIEAKLNKLVILFAALLVFFLGSVSFNLGGFDLTKKYQISQTDTDAQGFEYHGFYGAEQWPSGPVRWSTKEAEIRFKSEGEAHVFLHVQSINPQNTELDPTTIKIILDGTLVAVLDFAKIKDRAFSLVLARPGQHKMEIKVSRTWKPKDYGSPDQRTLGSAIYGLKLH